MNKSLLTHPKKKEDKYVEFDHYMEMWGIFGVDSGFCYNTYSSEEEANDNLN